MSEPSVTAVRLASTAAPTAVARPAALDWRTSLALLLVLHVVVWTWAGVESRSNLDAPGDMVEAYVWGQSLEWGYFKHPPLSAWITGLWFAWVPEGHFGYALLSALNGAVGLAGTALLARRLLPPDWALLGVAAAAATPGFTSLALRFNANAVLISTWPWALAMFVCMMQDGRRRDAVLCGVACALAMLGKYYSAVLLASMLVSALALPAWRRRFASAVPWIAIATLVVVLLPHLRWLLSQVDGPIQYAQSAAHESPPAATLRALQFGLSQWLFALFAFGLLALSLEPGRRWQAMFAAVTSLFRPRREACWLLAVLPIVATMLATVVTGARTASVWGLPIAAGVSVLVVSRASGSGARIDLRRTARALGLAWLLVALAAPALWLLAARLGSPAAGEPRQELAQELDLTWRAEFGGKLPWVSGTRALAASVAFYADSHPRYWSLWDTARETPWARPEQVFADGGIVVCAEDDHPCAAIAARLSQRRREVTVTKRARGFGFPPRRYVLYLLPPRPASAPTAGD